MKYVSPIACIKAPLLGFPFWTREIFLSQSTMRFDEFLSGFIVCLTLPHFDFQGLYLCFCSKSYFSPKKLRVWHQLYNKTGLNSKWGKIKCRFDHYKKFPKYQKFINDNIMLRIPSKLYRNSQKLTVCVLCIILCVCC